MARKIPVLERFLGAPALYAMAYGEIGSSLYYALGITAVYALSLTPVVFLVAGGIFALPLLAGVLQSSGRFGLLAFPLFFALADLGLRRPALHRAFVVFAPVVQVLAFGYVALGYLVP